MPSCAVAGTMDSSLDTLMRHFRNSLSLWIFLGTCVPLLAQTNSTVFIHVNLVPMSGEHVIRAQSVLIEGDTIKDVSGSLAVPAGAKVIDGRGTAYLSPGLADMHTHSDTREDLAVYLANGVTTILNMGEAKNGFVARTVPAVNRGDIPGPQVYMSFLVDGTPQYGNFVVTTADEARSLVRLAKTNGYNFIKVYNNLSPECFYALIDEGRIQHIPIIGHGVTQVGLERQLAAGQLLVAHTEEFLYTTFAKPGSDQNEAAPSMDQIPAAIAFLKRDGAFVTADLNTYMTIARQWGKPAVVEEFMRRPEVRYLAPQNRIGWRASRYASRKGDLSDRVSFLSAFTKALSDAGVPLVAGTDAPPIPGLVPGFSLHQNLHVLELAGLTPYQTLSTATRSPGEFIARAIPGSKPFGTIMVGGRADLILSANNPLEDLSTLEKPLGVMAHGRWYAASDLQSLLQGVAQTYDQAMLPH